MRAILFEKAGKVFRTKTKTVTCSFTRARINVVEGQFDLMLRYAGTNKMKREQILAQIEKKKVEALGLYVTDDGMRIAEVSLTADWTAHNQIIRVEGEMFNVDMRGWEDGICPEVSVAVNRIVRGAERLKMPIGSWIKFSREVRDNPSLHKELCDELGYCYGSSAPNWKGEYRSVNHPCPDLPELSINIKEIP